jgi:SH3-like domain-containing protein
MTQLTSRTQAPALLWATVALIALLVPLSAVGHVALAAAAALTAVTLPQPNRVRLATVLAMVPVAFDSAPSWAFVVAGGLLAALVATRLTSPAATPLALIQRHLEWCRRRDEPAHLLWVHAPGTERAVAAAALEAFRVTDHVALLEAEEANAEIVAMMDHISFERSGVERRLRAQLGEGPGFGWATFPDDGLTLEALFEHARKIAVGAASRPIERRAQVRAAYRRWDGRPHTEATLRSPNQG